MNKKIKIFLASPSDVNDEFNRAKTIIEELNRINLKDSGVYLELINWKSHAVGGMGIPQDLINNMLRPDACDIFIGILWMRFGTATGHNSKDGVVYSSGTEEEFGSKGPAVGRSPPCGGR